MSERHAWRILAAYRREGAAALAHGNRGRKPHNIVSDDEANAVVQLASTTYTGANHTHHSELLREREGIDLSRPTVRRILNRPGALRASHGALAPTLEIGRIVKRLGNHRLSQPQLRNLTNLEPDPVVEDDNHVGNAGSETQAPEERLLSPH